MVQLNVDPTTPLKTLIAAQATGLTIYVNGGIPTTGLPETFASIDANGGINTVATKRGNARCVLTVSIYTKLLSTGAVNTVKENITLGSFQSAFSSIAKATVSNVFYSYEPAKAPFVYSGKSLISGYSTKVININCFINY